VLAAGQGRQLLERAGIPTNDPLEHAPDAPPAPPVKQPVKQSSRPGREAKAAAADAGQGERGPLPRQENKPAADPHTTTADQSAVAVPGVSIPKVPLLKAAP